MTVRLFYFIVCLIRTLDFKDRDIGLTLENEPKKKKNGGHGEISVSLHFNVQSAPPPARKMEDLYTVGKELGRGGFSIVYEGTEKATGKKVAIKYVCKTDKDPDVIRLLQRFVYSFFLIKADFAKRNFGHV